MKRTKSASAASESGSGPTWTDGELAALEAAHPEGLSTQQVIALLSDRGARLSEATFRKYVQLGLLPRSVRVGRKGKRRGSQGLYPATVVRQVELIRRLMARGYTMAEIREEFVSLRGDIDDVVARLVRVVGALESAVSGEGGSGDEVTARAIAVARAMADALVAKLRAVEGRLAMRARTARAVV